MQCNNCGGLLIKGGHKTWRHHSQRRRQNPRPNNNGARSKWRVRGRREWKGRRDLVVSQELQPRPPPGPALWHPHDLVHNHDQAPGGYGCLTGNVGRVILV